MAFATLRDFDGEIDLVFFTKTYAECRHLLNLDEIIALKGTIDPDNERNPEKISFKVTSIADFAQLSRTAVRKEAVKENIPETESIKIKENQIDEVHIRLKEGAADNYKELNELRDYLADNSGSSTIYIHIPVTQGEKIVRAASGLDITSNAGIIEELKNCNCVAEVWRE